MNNRGFTVTELVVVISVLLLLTPLTFAFYRTFEGEYLGALVRVEAAQSMRTVSEEIRRDLQLLQVGEEEGLVLHGGECPRVEYLVTDGILLRRAPAACGGDRALARNVLNFSREGRALSISFGRRLRPGPGPENLRRTALRMAL
jgi:prepilin-type N-terminal cleavage/methylation domain-containing protein